MNQTRTSTQNHQSLTQLIERAQRLQQLRDTSDRLGISRTDVVHCLEKAYERFLTGSVCGAADEEMRSDAAIITDCIARLAFADHLDSNISERKRETVAAS